MRQFKTLLYFEMKKILMRKSTWITFGIFIAGSIFLMCVVFFGSTYIDGEFLETHMQGFAIDKEYGEKLSGRKVDAALLKEMQQAYKNTGNEKEKGYMLTDEYQFNIRPYSQVYTFVRELSRQAEINPLTITEEEFYQSRTNFQKEQWEQYHLTEKEQEYWQDKEENLEKPFIFQYATAYNNLLDMNGFYMICLTVTFILAVCLSSVFAEEHERRTDQMILCSRFGRSRLYFAKILAGSIVSFAGSLLFFIFLLAENFIAYGTEGFTAAIQLFIPAYSYSISIGGCFFILSGILFLSCILTGIFIMMLSELIHSKIGTMAIVIIVLFAARIIPIPTDYRMFSQLWNYIPINLIKLDAGFTDIRLVSLFGFLLTSWQFAPFLYIGLAVLFIWIGKKVYCRYQVEGR